ncbi:MAG: 4-alpha-glucanotransferase [Clostridia bacterium]|nr:4-alpha-glucanotransferase [Clostridia bacterium]
MERGCGIYMPIKDLNNKYGYGSFSKEAYEFIDYLSEHNIKYWQIDELSSFMLEDEIDNPSAFAVNPMYLDIEKYLEVEELEFFGLNREDLPSVYMAKKQEALRYIFDKLYYVTNIDKFIENNEYWVYDYAVYNSLKEELGESYNEFPLHYKNLDSKETISFIKSHSEEIIYHIFIQYLLLKDWKDLKKYAGSKGVKIISKISETCSYDSSDVYSKPKYFNLDTMLNASEFLRPEMVDSFEELEEIKEEELDSFSDLDFEQVAYNLDAMKKDRFEWWIERFEFNKKLYDYVIIENKTYEKVVFNRDNNKFKFIKEKINIFNTDILEWLKNNAIKHIILGNIGNNIEKEKFIQAKIKYPLISSLADTIKNLDENETCNIDKNTVLYLSSEFVDFDKLVSDEYLKEKLCCHINLTDKDFNKDNNLILKMSVDHILSSNADVVILNMKDILSLESDNNSKEKVESFQLNYQSKKYFEYLKQVVANKNR